MLAVWFLSNDFCCIVTMTCKASINDHLNNRCLGNTRYLAHFLLYSVSSCIWSMGMWRLDIVIFLLFASRTNLLADDTRTANAKWLHVLDSSFSSAVLCSNGMDCKQPNEDSSSAAESVSDAVTFSRFGFCLSFKKLKKNIFLKETLLVMTLMNGMIYDSFKHWNSSSFLVSLKEFINVRYAVEMAHIKMVQVLDKFLVCICQLV